MTYRVVYGDDVRLYAAEADEGGGTRQEQFSTEFEALRRAREVIDNDEAPCVAVYDADGNALGGVRLQLLFETCRD